MDSFLIGFGERPIADSNCHDTDLPQNNRRLARCLKTILSNEPLLEETKLRLRHALYVALLLEREFQRAPGGKSVSRRVRRFLAQVSLLVSDVVDTERRLIHNGVR